MSSTTDWHDDDDEEIGKLEAEIRNKYGDGSLEKLRRRRVIPDGTRLGSRVSNMGSNMNKETQVQIQTGAEILVSKEPHNNDGSGLVVAGLSEDDASASGKRTSSVIIQPWRQARKLMVFQLVMEVLYKRMMELLKQDLGHRFWVGALLAKLL
ncbi:hypothetical protein FRX31_012010 [Thalictrum thalictroides]|uniref:Uncharacterized protein n=1 Tax=Thalictrum thalictroides TaxID=46969 RepID=A0A7J6WQM6_THATH|nr:hypothetical protein FRX31_012010 [Thalictrum thalictroides]